MLYIASKNSSDCLFLDLAVIIKKTVCEAKKKLTFYEFHIFIPFPKYL